jgi:hypothetical protein
MSLFTLSSNDLIRVPPRRSVSLFGAKPKQRLKKKSKSLGRLQGLGQSGSFNPPDYFDTGWASVHVASAEYIGCDPLDLAELFVSESSYNPSATNSIGCVGLNQICQASYGFITGAGYSIGQYTQLTVSEQLPVVVSYFQNWMSQYGLGAISARDLYWLNFLPATYVPGSSDSYVISQQGDPYYSSNTGLDSGNKGYITAGDLQTRLDAQPAAQPNLWSYLEPQICLAGGCFGDTSTMVVGGLVVGFAGYYAYQKWGR